MQHLTAMMHLLVVLLMTTSLCMEGGGQSLFAKNPESTLAVMGDNVTLSCTLHVQACEDRQNAYNLYWQHKSTNGSPRYISLCRSIDKQYISKNWTVCSSDGSYWNLQIINVDSSYAGTYQCLIYMDRRLADHSTIVTLRVVSSINTVVEPSPQRWQEGQTSSFRCQAHAQRTDSFDWFQNKNGKWNKVQKSINFQLSKDKATLTINRLTTEHNGSYIACEVTRGTTSITRQRQSALLIVDPREERTTFFLTQGSPLQDRNTPIQPDGQNENTVQPSEASTIDKAGPSSDEENLANIPTSKDHDNPKPPPKPDGLSPTIIGGIAAAFILLLIIAFLLYFLLIKGRGKPDTHPTSQTPEAQDSGPLPDEHDTTETQLNVDVHSAIPHPISPDTKPVEISKPSTSVEVVADSNQQSSTDPNQGKANKLPTKDAAKLNTTITLEEAKMKSQTIGGNIAEALYARPNKSFIKTKTLGAVHAKDDSQKVIGQTTKQAKEPKQASLKIPKDDTQKRQESKKPTILVKPYTGAGRPTQNAGRATQDAEGSTQDTQPSTGVEPPKVVPYHISQARACATSQAAPEPADDGVEGAVAEDPRRKNVEGLIYADLDLRGRGGREDAGTSIIRTEEEALYADIVNKNTLGKLK